MTSLLTSLRACLSRVRRYPPSSLRLWFQGISFRSMVPLAVSVPNHWISNSAFSKSSKQKNTCGHIRAADSLGIPLRKIERDGRERVVPTLSCHCVACSIQALHSCVIPRAPALRDRASAHVMVQNSFRPPSQHRVCYATAWSAC